MLMFIFFGGSKKATLGKMQSAQEPCPSCRETGSLLFKFYRKHFHLYFVPMFPYKSVGSVTCALCGFHEEKIKKSSSGLYQEFKFLLPEFKKPLWQWTGALVLPSLIGLFIWFGISLNKKEREAIENLRVNYILSYKTQDGLYSTYLVNKVSQDSVWLTPNQYLSENKKGNRLYKRGNDYSGDTIAFHKADIQKMYEAGIIYSIKTNPKEKPPAND